MNLSTRKDALVSLAEWLFPALAGALALPAAAQTENPPAVPVEKAAYHVPVFRNDYVTLLNVYIPPNRASGYHRHSTDSIGLLLGDAERTGQVPGRSR